MTQRAQRILIVLALLLLLLLGVEFLLWAVVIQTGDYTWMLRHFVVGLSSLSPVGRYALAAAMILMPLFVAALAVRSMRAGVVLRARATDGDTVNLTEAALRQCLRHEIRSVPGVAGVESSARNAHKGPSVTVRLWIWAGTDVPAVRSRVRQVVAQSLRRLFGVGEIDKVRVIVEGLVFRDAAGKKVSRRPRSERRERPEPRKAPDAPAVEGKH